MMKRPKSDSRCIHCHEQLIEKTKDHAFPSSWYPETTPHNVQRWTVPSCENCNHKYGEMEKEIFVRLAVCVNPQKAAAAGFSKKALRSFGVGVTGITDEERRHRDALKHKVFTTAKPISSNDEAHIVPGLGPHPEASKDRQFQIDIPADVLFEVLKKIVRGCEYWLGNGRIIERPYEIEVVLAPAANLPVEVAQLIARFGPVHLGPGFRIRRGAAQDDSGSVLYEIAIWDTIDVYAAILPPEIGAATRKLSITLRR